MSSAWSGTVVGVQPRIRLLRSFDQRSHTYLGYVLHVDGEMDGETRVFTVGIGRGAEEKHAIRAGDQVSGLGLPLADPRKAVVDLYKVSRLTVRRGESLDRPMPPFVGVPPSLPEYQARRHRRLAKRTYDTRCTSCLWGARMAVEVIKDHWNPKATTSWRTETFCYGPKSCRLYKTGPTRKVPGRGGMVYEEEDWVDENETAHRGPDD